VTTTPRNRSTPSAANTPPVQPTRTSTAKAYPREASQAAFLLGGIGTGNVSVGSRGELRDWEIFNWPGKGNRLPFSFFAVRAETANGTRLVRVLESRLNGPHALSHGYFNGDVAGLPRFTTSTMRGTYPFVNVELTEPGVPLHVRMEAFTPFVPGDAAASGFPAAVIRYHVSNLSDHDMTVSVVGSLANAAGFAGHDVFGNLKLAGEVANTQRDGQHARGLYYTTDLASTDERFGTMGLATTEADVTVRPVWVRGEWTDSAQDFWNDLTSGRRIGATDEAEVAAKGSALNEYLDFSYLRLREKVGSIDVAKTIAGRTTATFEFVLTWHFPNRAKGWIEVDEDLSRHAAGGYPLVRNHYATRFTDAWSVLEDLLAQLPQLERDSRAFVSALYGSDLPAPILEAAADNITVLRSPTCFWLEDGYFYGWEGIRDYVGCGLGNVNHVWNYAQTVAFLFPELEQTMRSIEFEVEIGADGAMPFRSRQTLDEPRWEMVPAADGQLGAIVRVCREWRLTGDREVLARMWPAVERAMRYSLSYWDTDGDIVPDGQQNNTYDIEFYGPNGMTGTLMVAALRACADMADGLSDIERAMEFGDLASTSSDNLDRLCWNGRFYQQQLADPDEYRYQVGPGIHSDQLLGQFLAHVTGLGHVLPAEHVCLALATIRHHNFKRHMGDVGTVQRVYALNDEPGLVLCSWPDGGRPRFPFGYSDEVWTGVEYQVAASLIYEGMVDDAVTIVEGVRSRQDGFRRNPWSENEAGHHYTRSMASWALVTGMLGFSPDLGRRTVRFAPKFDVQEFSCFWSHGRGWGVYRQERDADGHPHAVVEVMHGTLGADHVQAPVPVTVLERNAD
jgi:non-lysosomal glucosylceramidase